MKFLNIFNLFVCKLIIGIAISIVVPCSAQYDPDSLSPQTQENLPRMIEFSWSAAPPMPQGMQDNAGGLIDNYLVMAGGFCGGFDDSWKPGIYPRGWLKKVWALNLKNKEMGWISLPDIPGDARQGLFGVSVNNELYIWGGFGRKEQYETYKDGYKLSRKNGEWIWSPLTSLPWHVAAGGICAIGSKIYILGGVDRDSSGSYKNDSYIMHDRDGYWPRLGARLIMYDIEDSKAGWREVSQCPGVPRMMPSMATVGGKIYVIGGLTFLKRSDGYAAVTDNWRFDPQSGQWERLREMPVSCGGFGIGQIVYNDRYMIIATGNRREKYMDTEMFLRPSYGKVSTVNRDQWKRHPRISDHVSYVNQIWVYDTQTNLFGTATKLPFDDNGSPSFVIGNEYYLFPGETAGFYWEGEYFGHHPEFVLKGMIKELKWEDVAE